MRSQHDTEKHDPGVAASRAHRWLPRAALVLVALAAIMGWGASFVGLHAYAMHPMTGFTWVTAWLVPATYDGAAFACTLVTYRSSINGRSALRGRVLMWGFTAVSSWINWVHQLDPFARLVAAGLPIAAVAVFDIVLIELRADYEARHGRQAFRLRPGLLLLRWLTDRQGTAAAFRAQITSIPVHELAGLRTRTTSTTTPDTTSAPVRPSADQQQPTRQSVSQPRETTPDTPPKPARQAASPGRVKLPPAMVTALERVTTEVAAEGREITAADVQRVIKVNDVTAERIVADVTNNNGRVAA